MGHPDGVTLKPENATRGQRKRAHLPRPFGLSSPARLNANEAKVNQARRGVAFVSGNRAIRSNAECGIDPRVVLAQVLLSAACGFALSGVAAGALAGVFICALLLFMGRRHAAAVLAAWTIGINVVCQALLLVPHWGVAGVFAPAFFVMRKMVPIAGAALLFWNGLTVSRLIAVLTKWRIPKGFTLTLAIAYRFMPTIGNEVGAIRDALAMRGRALTVRGFFSAPREMGEYVLVPLMMRCTRIADELAASATTRAVENPEPRTSRLDLRMRRHDWLMLALTLAAVAAVVAAEVAL